MCVNDEKGPDINLKTVYSTCDVCRVMQSVALHNPIWQGFLGGGSYGISYALLAMWNCVEGASVSFTTRQLDINEATCSLFYHRANEIMSADAFFLQDKIAWGTGTSKTVEVELDATVICKWREVNDSGEMVYKYYCYIGARQRGAIHNFAIAPLGISQSVGEGRVNPEGSEAYHRFCSMVFKDKKHNLLSMTDGNNTYDCRCEQCTTLFEEHHSVNHSRRPVPEFSRPIEAVIADVQTGETREALASTHTLDVEWGLLKSPLPRNLTARTAREMERCDLLLRAQQWRRMNSTGDKWAAFLAAAKRYSARKVSAVVATQGKVGDFAKRVGQKRRAARQGQVGGRGDAAEGVVPLLDAESAALHAALSDSELQGKEKEAAEDILKDADGDANGGEDTFFLQCLQAWGDRYFEKQEQGRCGQHAVNNLLGRPQYTVQDMEASLDSVLAELGADSRSAHGNAAGWYSHSVLAHVLTNTVPPTWKLGTRRVVSDGKHWSLLHGPGTCALLLNIGPGLHWTCIVPHLGQTFYVDSQHFPPSIIDESDFQAILAKHPDAYFVLRHDVDEDMLVPSPDH